MAPGLFSCFHPNMKNKTTSLENVHAATENAYTEGDKRPGSVLVELFSSQGCKTSSEAELLLSRIGRGDFELEVPVIVLAFHVDYWDYMGWKDPFGSSQWTVRQKSFVEILNLDTMFTPQVVVQGRIECAGTNEDAILSNIKTAMCLPAPTLQATFQMLTKDALQVSLVGSLRTKIDNQGADVMVALYENGLVTDCPKGENKGRVLSNDFVVRRLEKLCTVKDMSTKKSINGIVKFSVWDNFNSAKCGIVVFVQNNSFQTLCCQEFQLPDNL